MSLREQVDLDVSPRNGPVRQSERTTAPLSPGLWELDAACSHATATIRHALFSKVHGQFPQVTGLIHVAEQAEQSSVSAQILTAGLDTGNATRDERLRTAEYLDVERFPLITFKSALVRRVLCCRWSVVGDLTIRDRTRPVVLSVDDVMTSLGADGVERVRLLARAELSREEFGLDWNQTLDTGGLILGRTITVSLAVEAVRREAVPVSPAI